MRGRKPKPSGLRLIEGNPGHRKIKNEPKPVDEKPRCPKWLSGEAKIAFKRICAELDGMGILRRADLDIISCLALAVGDLVDCRIQFCLTGSRFQVEGRADSVVLNPLLRAQYRSMAVIARLSAQLALDPTSRARIDMPESEQPKSLRELLLAEE